VGGGISRLVFLQSFPEDVVWQHGMGVFVLWWWHDSFCDYLQRLGGLLFFLAWFLVVLGCIAMGSPPMNWGIGLWRGRACIEHRFLSFLMEWPS
jgi:hypothetical protein